MSAQRCMPGDEQSRHVAELVSLSDNRADLRAMLLMVKCELLRRSAIRSPEKDSVSALVSAQDSPVVQDGQENPAPLRG